MSKFSFEEMGAVTVSFAAVSYTHLDVYKRQAVMAAPTSTPKKRLAVSRSRILFIRAPAAASRPELIICIPCKNNARPPSSPNISEMPISFFPFSRSPSRQEKRHSPRLNVQEQVRCV